METAITSDTITMPKNASVKALTKLIADCEWGLEQLNHQRKLLTKFRKDALDALKQVEGAKGYKIVFTKRARRPLDSSTEAWRRRSDAAKRAVATKRRKYKTWPTRKGDHK